MNTSKSSILSKVAPWAKNTLRRALAPRVSVGSVRLPLHGKADSQQRLLHHLAMQEMAGSNWQGQPRGFRVAPTSPKNPRTHTKGATTRAEALARDAARAGAL